MMKLKRTRELVVSARLAFSAKVLYAPKFLFTSMGIHSLIRASFAPIAFLASIHRKPVACNAMLVTFHLHYDFSLLVRVEGIEPPPCRCTLQIYSLR